MPVRTSYVAKAKLLSVKTNVEDSWQSVVTLATDSGPDPVTEVLDSSKRHADSLFDQKAYLDAKPVYEDLIRQCS